MAGYSPNPLWKKLGYKSGMRVYVHQAPQDYRQQLALPREISVSWLRVAEPGVGMVHAYVRSLDDLRRGIAKHRRAIAPDGSIWISWPKKASKIQTDITEDRIREVILPIGLVDIKVCAVDETWSGLKLVIRKELR